MKKDNSSKEEQEVIAVTDTVTQWMIARDVSSLESLLDKNFTLTHITGYVQSKAEWLNEIKTESMKYYSFEPVSRKVNITGNTARVIQQNRLDARIWGSRNTWPLQQIFKLEKRNNQWIVLSSVASTF